jgi:hypothetical protein
LPGCSGSTDKASGSLHHESSLKSKQGRKITSAGMFFHVVACFPGTQPIFSFLLALKGQHTGKSSNKYQLLIL